MCIERITNYLLNRTNNNDYSFATAIISSSIIIGVFYYAIKQLIKCCSHYKGDPQIHQQLPKKIKVEGEEEIVDNLTTLTQRLNEHKKNKFGSKHGQIFSKDPKKLIQILHSIDEFTTNEPNFDQKNAIDLLEALTERCFILSSHFVGEKNDTNTTSPSSCYQQCLTKTCNTLYNLVIKTHWDVKQRSPYQDYFNRLYDIKRLSIKYITKHKENISNAYKLKLETILTDLTTRIIKKEYEKQTDPNNNAVLNEKLLPFVVKSTKLSIEEKNHAFRLCVQPSLTSPPPKTTRQHCAPNSILLFLTETKHQEISSFFLEVLYLPDLLHLQETFGNWFKETRMEKNILLTISKKICFQIHQREIPQNMQNKVQNIVDETTKIFSEEQELLKTIGKIII